MNLSRAKEQKKNPYDVRQSCDAKEDTDCYPDVSWIKTFMDQTKVKIALGITAEVPEFALCNDQVGEAFIASGDATQNSALLLTDLVNDGIRLLVYAGNADYYCNFIVSG